MADAEKLTINSVKKNKRKEKGDRFDFMKTLWIIT